MEIARKKTLKRARKIIVSTCDSYEPYEVIQPIIFNTTNRGIFSSVFRQLKNKYQTDSDYESLLQLTEMSQTKSLGAELGGIVLSLFDVSFGYEGSVGQQDFDYAFYLCVAEMRLRAAVLYADAIIGMRMDFDLDTVDRQAFYLQMYGTAIRYKNRDHIELDELPEI